MKWTRRESDDRNVIDVRGASGRRSSGGSGGFGGLSGGNFPMPGGGKGVGGIVGLIVIAVLLGTQVLGGGSGGSGFDIESMFPQMGNFASADQASEIPASMDPDRDLRDFSAFVFSDAQDVWSRAFVKWGKPWQDAKLVLFSHGVNTGGCGSATSSVGPFYCPADHRVYLDLSFYKQMGKELKADGDFAWAYVIAHEMGHHVQNQGGIEDQVNRARREQSESRNAISVRNELQADCLAGVWASTVFDKLEPGDIEEAMTASEAVGDDRLQGRGASPESFTHGTSEQRKRWFRTGFDSGDPNHCDTFSGDI